MKSKKSIAMFGSHIFGKAALKCLLAADSCLAVSLVATDDPVRSYCNPAGRLWQYGWDKSVASLVPRMACRYGISVFSGRVRDHRLLTRLQNEQIEGILVFCYGQLLPPPILQLVGGRAYNIHPVVAGGDLCDTGGPSPLEAAASLGAKQLQLAVHTMTEEFDAGEIVARGRPVTVPCSLRTWVGTPGLYLSEIQGVYRALCATTEELLGNTLSTLF